MHRRHWLIRHRDAEGLILETIAVLPAMCQQLTVEGVQAKFRAYLVIQATSCSSVSRHMLSTSQRYKSLSIILMLPTKHVVMNTLKLLKRYDSFRQSV